MSLVKAMFKYIALTSLCSNFGDSGKALLSVVVVKARLSRGICME